MITGEQVFGAKIAEFFEAHQSPFGATNILPDHIPSAARVSELVVNAMVVDLGIARGYARPAYEQLVRNFARNWALRGHDGRGHEHEQGWFSGDPLVYVKRLAHLRKLSAAAFRAQVEEALDNCIDSIHLFCPKQCNMACRGCYANAIPIDRFPYRASEVHSYVEGAKAILAEAIRLGARTVQTSGDGELTAFPRFFDLLDWVASNGLQWLFFTAGAIFGSESAARAHWADAEPLLSSTTRERIARNIRRASTSARPTADAFVLELDRVKDHLQIYHSVWSTSQAQNNEWRNPRFPPYEYQGVEVAGRSFALPASVLALMRVFDGSHRGRLGIESPVGPASRESLTNLAAWVVDHGLRSYFEPVITTGRARSGMCHLQADEEQGWLRAAEPLLVRSMCSFRFIHQAIVKARSSPDGEMQCFVTPGTAMDLDDLERANVLSSLRIEPGRLFSALRSGVVARSNYVYTTGCKCNDFSLRMQTDRDRLVAEWQAAAAEGCPAIATPEDLLQRL